MPAYTSYVTTPTGPFGDTGGGNAAWIDTMPGSGAPVQINAIGSAARIRNTDGTWTVFHGDVFGFSIVNGQLQGTIRWIVRATAGDGSFGTMAELEAYGGMFDTINVDARTFLNADANGRHALLFDRPGMVFHGDGFNNTFAGGTGQDIYFGGAGMVDAVSYARATSFVTVSLDGSIRHQGDAFGDQFAGIESLIGSRFSDVLRGDGGRNVLYGGDGHDVLFGGDGTDILYGGAGNDSLDPGIGGAHGPQQVSGGDGVDELVLLSQTWWGVDVTFGVQNSGTVFLQGTIDFLMSMSGIENIRGTHRADRIGGSDDPNTHWGEGGNDTLYGENGADRLFGGADDDRLYGGAGNDTLWGDGGADTLYGGYGDDLLIGDGLFDTVAYDQPMPLGSPQFTDLYVSLVDWGDALAISSGGGIDTLRGISHVIGTIGTDYIAGNSAANRLDGADGNDRIAGGGGDDTVLGGAGNDVLFGDADWGFQGGSDVWGNDTLNGGTGDDWLIGGHGYDSYIGGRGTDTLDYSSYIDELGNGEYHLEVDLARGIVRKLYWSFYESMAFEVGIDRVQATGNERVETVQGTMIGDSLLGSGESDTFLGGGGADRLVGRGGDDWLDGGSGDDLMEGGVGADTYIVDSAGDRIVETADPGIDTVRSSVADYTLGARVENLILMAGAVSGTGNGAINMITGNSLSNSLSGLGGADTLSGGAGNDRIDGGAGDDSLLGGNGQDVLIGGLGADVMDGGAGADTFVWAAVTHSTAAAPDLIRAFDSLDVIDLSGIDANGRRAGEGQFIVNLADADAVFDGTAGRLRIVMDGADYRVEGDVNGDGIADLVIRVSLAVGTPGLSAYDFIL